MFARLFSILERNTGIIENIRPNYLLGPQDVLRRCNDQSPAYH